MLNSIMNEGVKGLQSSQKEMLKSATEINKATVVPGSTENSQVLSIQNTSFPAVNESQQSYKSSDNLSEPLIELRRQEQLFDASAKVISVVDQTVGSLLDVRT